MITAFSRIVAAFMEALSAAPAVCVVDQIYRAREKPIPDQVDQAVNVRFAGAFPSPGAIAGAPVDWGSRISVEIFARGVQDAGDVAVDPLLLAVYARMAGDTTLGGLVADIGVPVIEAENTDEGKKIGWIRLTYLVQHRTNNLTVE